jgi:Ser/Thr protein kinase RdoA (MazF antagonist)
MNPGEVVDLFRFSGSLVQVEPFGCGHINDTYVATFKQADGTVRRYILQRINQFVFKDPAALMENTKRVTCHLSAKIREAGGDPLRETLNLVETVDSRDYTLDSSGEFWRAYLFIEGARTYESAETPQQIYQAAWAFGNFQRQLADFPAARLHETIPNFHNTPQRFQAFVEAVQRDAHNRAASVRAEIQFLERREAETHILVDLVSSGALPLRVTHNDTKLNNVMIDDQTGRAICILDLDTVMPGLALYDFGDAVRSAAALVAEDAPESSGAGISLETFDSLAHGYLDAARNFLTAAEVDLLAFSARLITLEQAIRFLGDYLNGDIYYKIHRPGHNLQRARTQIGMLSDMEPGRNYEKMNRIISKYR